MLKGNVLQINEIESVKSISIESDKTTSIYNVSTRVSLFGEFALRATEINSTFTNEGPFHLNLACLVSNIVRWIARTGGQFRRNSPRQSVWFPGTIRWIKRKFVNKWINSNIFWTLWFKWANIFRGKDTVNLWGNYLTQPLIAASCTQVII